MDFGSVGAAFEALFGVWADAVMADTTRVSGSPSDEPRRDHVGNVVAARLDAVRRELTLFWPEELRGGLLKELLNIVADYMNCPPEFSAGAVRCIPYAYVYTQWKSDEKNSLNLDGTYRTLCDFIPTKHPWCLNIQTPINNKMVLPWRISIWARAHAHINSDLYEILGASVGEHALVIPPGYVPFSMNKSRIMKRILVTECMIVQLEKNKNGTVDVCTNGKLRCRLPVSIEGIELIRLTATSRTGVQITLH
jgi:hypothetical protein